MEQGYRTLTASDLRDTSTTQDTELGALGLTGDGRRFRYGKAGAGALAAGKLAVAEAIVSNHTNIAVAANAAIGDTRVQVTLGATATTQGLYDEGYLTVNAGTGAGISYKISGTPVIGSAGTGYIYLEEPLKVALTSASSKVSLHKSPFKDVVHSTTASLAVGVPTVAIAAASYGWFQTQGICSVLSDGVVAKDTGFIQSTSVAGAVVTEAAGTLVARLGWAPEATVDTEYRQVFLTVE